MGGPVFRVGLGAQGRHIQIRQEAPQECFFVTSKSGRRKRTTTVRHTLSFQPPPSPVLLSSPSLYSPPPAPSILPIMTHNTRMPLLDRFVGGVRQFVTDTRVRKVPCLTPGGVSVALFTSRIASRSPILDRLTVEEDLKSCIKELLTERDNLKEQLQEARDAPLVPQQQEQETSTTPDNTIVQHKSTLEESPAIITALEAKIAELSAGFHKLQQILESKSVISRGQLRARKTAEEARDAARDAAAENAQTIEQLRAQLRQETDARRRAEEDLQCLRADLKNAVSKREAAEAFLVDIREDLTALRIETEEFGLEEESTADEDEQDEVASYETESEYEVESEAEDEDGYDSDNHVYDDDEEYSSESEDEFETDYDDDNDDSDDSDVDFSRANIDYETARLATLVFSPPGPPYGFAENITFVHMSPLPSSLPPSPHTGFDSDFAHDFANDSADESTDEFGVDFADDFSDEEMSPDSGHYSEDEL